MAFHSVDKPWTKKSRHRGALTILRNVIPKLISGSDPRGRNTPPSDFLPRTPEEEDAAADETGPPDLDACPRGSALGFKLSIRKSPPEAPEGGNGLLSRAKSPLPGKKTPFGEVACDGGGSPPRGLNLSMAPSAIGFADRSRLVLRSLCPQLGFRSLRRRRRKICEAERRCGTAADWLPF